MTLDEFNKTVQDIRNAELETFEKNKALFEKAKTENVKLYGLEYVSRLRGEVDIDVITTIDSLINKLNNVSETLADLKDKLVGFECDYDIEISVGDCYIEESYVEYYYYQLFNEEQVENKIKSKIREYLADKLKPESFPFSYSRPIDCKLLGLFKDGTISWEALQKLTYSDCEI